MQVELNKWTNIKGNRKHKKSKLGYAHKQSKSTNNVGAEIDKQKCWQECARLSIYIRFSILNWICELLWWWSKKGEAFEAFTWKYF